MRTISKILLSLSIPLFAQACVSGPEKSDGGDVERGPLAKADAIGSCEAEGGGDFCGGMSEGNCWCDEACHDFGDCCSDKVDVCDGGEPTLCLGDNHCGEGEVCDHSECLSNCPDGQICPAVCWGQCMPDQGGADECLSSEECGDGEYCHFEAECGEGPVGSCEEIPEVCIEIFAPVCGCDGETYGNDCFAAGAGVSVQHQGECDAEPPPPADTCEGNCGGNAGSCWCDELCSTYGDCCDDYEAQCTEPEPPSFESCDEAVVAFEAETNAIRSCESDVECGQVLAGTSCGCTNNWVARTDADISDWQEIRQVAGEMSCELPGMISTCDCPAVDGFACNDGTCSWNYTG